MKNIYENATSKYFDLMCEVIQEKEDLHHLVGIEEKICFLESDKREMSSGLVFADTRLVKGVWTAFCNYYFIITFYLPNTELLNEDQFRILMWHELKHCGIKASGTYLVPHSVQDFAIIIKECGIDWIE